MIKLFMVLGFSLILTVVYGQDPRETEDWSREPEVVIPGRFNMPPSDAKVLLGSSIDLVHWEHRNGDPVRWEMKDGVLTVIPGTGDILSKARFGDVQLHVEWRTPEVVTGSGQGRGNSGVFLMDRYEVQVLDSWENETHYNGQAASIYKQHIPLVNASLPPGEWQTYDIFFIAPRFNDDGSLKSPAYVTVLHNGILVQNHVELLGPTRYIGFPEYEVHDEKMPIRLQNHGDSVSFRNIWVREIDLFND
ncbi:3-keto-disaccharide hydrolase [Alkalitalea saponilacus]|uniref:3-keto-alpha-glucoside-1,2-lyase/3-keto-2-hydroxy-glucal hydratase domain-containing protein n=1 Tax=Alkalitalea saponilacus TaxID=889453 RepID=A0A1T5AB06_9BACT|nr:DUF1080 domain-containing protein [Alkalitalea saponilacus]ASB48763.1 hypothetical protein CDL62_06250 [Alkalitalea saponilacus]SKB32144.1 protein of unknown function [Alkalitalea saponilacus]